MSLESINPATGKLIQRYEAHNEAEVIAAIEAAHMCYLQWRKSDFERRASCLRKAASILREKKQEYGLLITREMGKPLSQATAEIEKCAQGCEHYAEHGEQYLTPESVDSSAKESFVAFEPMGIVLAVMPWNFPFWQVFRFVAPALMAGNAGLLKHASNVSGCALAIEAVLLEAGFPKGLFKTLLIPSSRVEAVIKHPAITAVTLTGSGPAGAAVASAAGHALKKSVLELGGNDAYVVLKDADLSLAARICVQSRMNNAGQTCIAAKRFIVEQSVKAEFEELITKEVATYAAGDPEQVDTKMGPMARADLREELQRQVDKSIEMGASCLLGGKIPGGAGAYYPATLLSNVTDTMPAFREELFGPVACIIPARDEDHALQLANDSVFGLGAAVFSQNIDKARKIAQNELEAGICVVNDFVRSDPLLPFGGIKQSGYGRELSYFGIREFVNIKAVYVGPQG